MLAFLFSFCDSVPVDEISGLWLCFYATAVRTLSDAFLSGVGITWEGKDLLVFRSHPLDGGIIFLTSSCPWGQNTGGGLET